ncbi:hypothetical protein DV736_g3228, partial [Chaetothyriales sp. CBS 134916]
MSATVTLPLSRSHQRHRGSSILAPGASLPRIPSESLAEKEQMTHSQSQYDEQTSPPDRRPSAPSLRPIETDELKISKRKDGRQIHALPAAAHRPLAHAPSRPTRFLLELTEPYTLLHSIISDTESRRIFYFMLLNLAFMVVQSTYGYLTGSLGLISDSIHMFFDCVALFVGLCAAVMSKWPPSVRFPYGYGKIDTLAGLGNGVFLMLISVEIVFEAMERLFSNASIERTTELLVVSSLGLLVNLVGISAFHASPIKSKKAADGHHHGENMQGIYLHIMADALGSVAVVLSTLFIQFSGWSGWDPLASCIIAILIFASTVPLVTSTTKTLLLSLNSDIEYNLRDILAGVSNIPGVVGYAVPRFWLEDVKKEGGHHGHTHGHTHDHSQKDHGNGESDDPTLLGVIHVTASQYADLVDVEGRDSDGEAFDAPSVEQVDPSQSHLLRAWSRDDTVDNVTDFLTLNNLTHQAQLFEKASILLGNEAPVHETPSITEEEINALRNEAASRWSQPRLLYFAVMVCSLGSIEQGWAQTCMNGANLYFPKAFGIDSRSARDVFIVGLINSGIYLSIGVLGCWLAEPVNSLLGRRGTIFLGSTTCLIASTASALSQSWPVLLAFRFLLGIGLALDNSTISIYLAECAPAAIRGGLAVSWQMFTAFGIFLGFIANVAVYNYGPNTWRLQLVAPIIPALPLMILIYTLPESPSWLIKQTSRYDKAFLSLRRLRNTDLQAAKELYATYLQRKTQHSMPTPKRTYAQQLLDLVTKPRIRRATLAAYSVMLCQQLCGINIIAFYSSSIFSDAGFSNFGALLASCVSGFIMFVGAFPAIWMMDTLGRRTLLLLTLPITGLTMFGAGLSFMIPAENAGHFYLLAGTVYLFSLEYSPGMGPVPNTYCAEAFPLSHRELGMSSSVAVANIWATILSFTFPRLLTALGAQGSFELYAFLNIVAVILVFFFVPETKMKTLDELDQVFAISSRRFIHYQVTEYLPWLVQYYVLCRKEATLSPLLPESNYNSKLEHSPPWRSQRKRPRLETLKSPEYNSGTPPSTKRAVDAGYLDDPFAKLLNGAGEVARRLPLMNRGTYLRTTAIDQVVSTFLASAPPGRKQIISLGAGSDTRYFRLKHKQPNVDLLYHELDFAANTRTKILGLRSAPFAAAVKSLCHIDIRSPVFEITDDGSRLKSPAYNIHPQDLRLLAPGKPALPDIDATLPTLLISECCLIYLNPDHADAVLQYFCNNGLFSPSSVPLAIVIYEPIRPNDPFGRTMIRNLTARGIQLQTLHNGAAAVDIDWVWKTWIGDAEKERVDALEWMDEVEEFVLLARHYCLAFGWRSFVDNNDGAHGWKSLPVPK